MAHERNQDGSDGSKARAGATSARAAVRAAGSRRGSGVEAVSVEEQRRATAHARARGRA